MIRNRYSYLTPSVQDTKWKERRTIKILQAESQKDSLFTENWPNVYQKSKFDQDIYAKHNIQWQKKFKKKGKRKVQRALQSQTAALPRHQEEEETDKTKQALIEQTYDKH